jgi:hypothetical protein
LGHTDGPCLLPCQAFNDDFTIIDSDGIHEVALDYCGCQLALPKTIQLLCSRLFPSTVIDLKTAATFRVLETFQMLSFTSKVSGYEYYRSLARRTDNTGTLLIPVRFINCILFNCHLTLSVDRIVIMPLCGWFVNGAMCDS